MGAVDLNEMDILQSLHYLNAIVIHVVNCHYIKFHMADGQNILRWLM